MASSIYLIPAPLGDTPVDVFMAPFYLQNITGLKFLIVENVRSARRLLKKIDPGIDINSITFFILDKQTTGDEIHKMTEPLREGNDMGLLSEAGIPCIADPGARIVHQAHRLNARVIPIPGASSIFLALAASGFNGQQFCFHGYLPIQKGKLKNSIKTLESRVNRDGITQIFIETPYRNHGMMETLIDTCSPQTLLCIACDITLSSEYIQTKTISDWKNDYPDLKKRPAVFLLGIPGQ